MSGELLSGRDLSRHNRRILAERLGWPAGALAECERIERIYPEWDPVWMDHCAWNDRPAGYYATRRQYPETRVYGATPEELEAAIEGAPPPWRSVYDGPLWTPTD